MAKVKYAGQKIDIGGTEFIVPALSVGQAEELSNAIQEIVVEMSDSVDKRDDGAFFRAGAKRIQLLGTALRRNYPDVTDEWLREEVSLTAWRRLWPAVLGISDAATETQGE